MLIRLAALLTLLFSLPIMLIRAQSGAGEPLRVLFSRPADCAAPCLLGVRPRVTAWETARALLAAHPAVETVTVQTRNRRPYLSWTWVDWPQASADYGFTVRDGLIDALTLPPETTLGAVWLALGEPGRITVTTNGDRAPRVAFVLEYPARALHVYAEFRVCEINRAALWRIPADRSAAASFYVGSGPPDYIRVMPYRPVQLDRRAWAGQLQALCQS
jgi:hypothetical protein